MRYPYWQALKRRFQAADRLAITLSVIAVVVLAVTVVLAAGEQPAVELIPDGMRERGELP